MSDKAGRLAWRLPRLPAAVIPIYGTTLVDLLGYTLMIPLLPAVAERYGASDVTVGALLSVPALCSTVAAPMWGQLSDRLGRKSILLISQTLSLGGYLLLALSHSLVLMFVSRIISGIGAGNVGAAQSYIADVTSKEERDEAFALYGVVFGAGFVLGPVASGLLMRHGIAVPFFFAAGLEVFNLLLTGAFLPSRTKRTEPPQLLRSSLFAAIKPAIGRIFTRQFLFVFSVVYFLSGFALYVRRELHINVTSVSWLLALAGVVGALVQVLMVAPLAARLGDRKVSQLGFLVLAIAYGMLLLAPQLAVYLAVLTLWAAGAALVAPTLMALLASRAPSTQRGAVMGFGDSVSSIALIVAPLAGAALAQSRFVGILPLCATLVALWIARVPLQRKRP